MEAVDLSTLESWMDVSGFGRGPIREACLLSGGTQNILLCFARNDDEFVLRRPPKALRANSNEAMRREARVLGALNGTCVRHPRLVAACPDEDVLGVALYLMEPLDGFNATTGLPVLHAGDAAIRHRIGLSMVQAIAALAAIDYCAAGLATFGKPDGFLERRVSRRRAQLASYADHAGWTGPETLPSVDRVANWLERHRPTRFTLGIFHGDFHLANVMIRPDRKDLAAVVDWDLCTIGDPIMDLGWLLATWPEGDVPSVTDVAATPWQGFATPTEMIAHYCRSAAATSQRSIGMLYSPAPSSDHPGRYSRPRLRRRGAESHRRPPPRARDRPVRSCAPPDQLRNDDAG